MTACSTGAHAIGDAARIVALDDADVMVAGGAEAAVCRIGMAGFAAARALSTSYNDMPKLASRPWDKDVMVLLWVKELELLCLKSLIMQKLVVPKYMVKLKAMVCRVMPIILPPLPMMVMEVSAPCEAALKRAGLDAGDIDYVNAHGTSTPLGDIIEAKAVARLLGDASPTVSISSTKSATGHLLGAAGAIEAIYTIKTVQTGDLPPTLNLNKPEDALSDLDLVPLKSRNKKVRNAMSNSFGFGGTNASLIMGEVA